MKINVTFSIDCEVLKEFISVLNPKDDVSDEVIEELLRGYIRNKTGGSPTPPDDWIKFTKEFIDDCIDYKVGQFTNIFLRGFLERGVASEEEVEEMQKASGMVTCKKLEIPHGLYCNQNFRIAFPLLIDEEHKKSDDGNNFWTQPSTIYGKSFYICSQWATSKQREAIEKWILEHLPKWFENADENQRADMIKFIKLHV